MLSKTNLQHHYDRFDTKFARNGDKSILKPKRESMGSASEISKLAPKTSPKQHSRYNYNLEIQFGLRTPRSVYIKKFKDYG